TARAFPTTGVDALVNFLVLREAELAVVTPSQVAVIELGNPAQATSGERALTSLGLANERQLGPLLVAAPVSREFRGMTSRYTHARDAGGRMRQVGDRLAIMADPDSSERRDAVVLDLERGRFEPAPSLNDNDVDLNGGTLADGPNVLRLQGGEGPPAQIDQNAMPPRQRQNIQELERRNRSVRNGTANAQWQRLYVAGDEVYLTGKRGLTGHDLSRDLREQPQWRRFNSSMLQATDPSTNLKVDFDDHAILLFELADQGKGPVLRITPFSREVVNGRLSGNTLPPVYVGGGVASLTDRPIDWQVADGGVALIDINGNLIWLPGSDE
ncbi:MAG: hypothetical protein AAGK78_14585, partial [Planctomycetota bacterium]